MILHGFTKDQHVINVCYSNLLRFNTQCLLHHVAIVARHVC